MPSKNIFIQGYPGTGKTTLIKTLLPRLGAAGGFYTEEIREHGTRKGFRLITLQGEQGTLAHVASTSCFRVGKYGIQRETLEALGVASLRAAIDDGRKELVVIDEVAAMELSSPRFRVAVSRAQQPQAGACHPPDETSSVYGQDQGPVGCAGQGTDAAKPRLPA